jgi:hypothetical protein
VILVADSRADGFRSVHPVKLGLFFSEMGTMMFTSVPRLRLSLWYAPVGHTVSRPRPYWRLRRRRSPTRCEVPNSEKARSRNMRSTRALAVPGSVGATMLKRARASASLDSHPATLPVWSAASASMRRASTPPATRTLWFCVLYVRGK